MLSDEQKFLIGLARAYVAAAERFGTPGRETWREFPAVQGSRQRMAVRRLAAIRWPLEFDALAVAERAEAAAGGEEDRHDIEAIVRVVRAEYARTMEFGMTPAPEDYRIAIEEWLRDGIMPGEDDLPGDDGAAVTRRGVLSVQVCVPAGWSDAEAEAFANRRAPAGTTHGWKVRTDPAYLAGDPARNPCAARAGYVHIMLDC